jgi:hypothetical protein
MQQRHSTSGSKLQPTAGRTTPIPLDEAALKQVSGGLRPVATAAPNGTWGTPKGTWGAPNGNW